MYRYSNGQISLSDFQQPMGMRLREDNRWVKKAQSIPWDKIEEKYADLFPSETGNVAKPLQLALGACLIQREYGYSDVETVLQIQENPYLQYFCGYAGYDDSKLPFDASSMVHFRKRLTPEVLAQINEMVIQEAQKTEDNDNQDDNKPDGGGNSGTIIVDATCAPSNIRYPQDVSLLNEARENAEKLLDILHSPTDGKKPRTYRKRARKDYLKYVRCRKHTAKMTRKAIGKQLNYLKRDLAAIDGKLNQEKALNIHQTERLETIRKIYEQQKYMYDNHTHSVENRIVSVSQPFVRPIVRGKVGKPVEFGMKLDISVTDGWTRLEYRSFDAYNEATKLQEMIENFHKREGHYPSRVLADKIYRNRENLSYCKARGIRLSGPALGRPQKGEDRNKAQDYRDECERVEVERKFSLGKRKCGMGLVTAKLEETAAHVVALSILLLNLRKIQCAFLQFLDWLLGLLQSREKRMVIRWTLIILLILFSASLCLLFFELNKRVVSKVHADFLQALIILFRKIVYHPAIQPTASVKKYFHDFAAGHRAQHIRLIHKDRNNALVLRILGNRKFPEHEVASFIRKVPNDNRHKLFCMVLHNTAAEMFCNHLVVDADPVNNRRIVSFPGFIVNKHLAQGSIYIKVGLFANQLCQVFLFMEDIFVLKSIPHLLAHFHLYGVNILFNAGSVSDGAHIGIRKIAFSYFVVQHIGVLIYAELFHNDRELFFQHFTNTAFHRVTDNHVVDMDISLLTDTVCTTTALLDFHRVPRQIIVNVY